MLRHLNALIIAADKDGMLLVSGDGNVIEPDDGIAGIGSGGPFALASARSLLKHTDMDAEEIAREALSVASEICVFTNDNIQVEVIG